MPVTVVVGGQYGGEGKGKICAHLALTDGVYFMVRCGGPNSGHTVDVGGRRYELKQVPSGFINPRTRLLLAAGALINLSLFLEEVELCGLNPDRIGVDRNAMIIEQSDIDAERGSDLRRRLGSTNQGVGAAVSRRVARVPGLRLAQDVAELRPFVTTVAEELREAHTQDKKIVVEGTQGFGLSLYHTEQWPYCTSRDTTAHSFLGEVGLGVRDFQVIMCVRTYPIRVGGNSGPLPNEVTWEEVQRRSGYPHAIAEYTTTTKRLRRVAQFDWAIVRRALAANSPSLIALHGTDYIDYGNKSSATFEQLTPETRAFVADIERNTSIPVALIGTGPTNEEIIDRRLQPPRPMNQPPRVVAESIGASA